MTNRYPWEAGCRPRDEHQGGMEHDLSQQGLRHCHQEVADLQRHGGRRRGRGRRRGWGRRGECPGFNMMVLPNAELCGLWLAFLFQMVLYNVHMWYILNPWRVKSVERKDWKPPPFRDAIMHACRTCAFLLIDLHYREKTLHLSWGGGVNFCVTFNTVFPDFFLTMQKT